MSTPRASQGTADLRDLARRLAAAGATVGADDVAALVEGVAAAPEAWDAEAWLALVGGKPDAALKAELGRHVETARAGRIAEKVSPSRSQRLTQLRAELARRDLEGFIVPRADEHQGEYVPARAERLAWLTGFTGSAGAAIVLKDRAAVFIDGRYVLQVKDEVNPVDYAYCHLVDEPPAEWIAKSLKPKGRLGYDPWLHTPNDVERLTKACAKAGGELVAVDINPIDIVWADQPPPPLAPVVAHDVAFAGAPSAEKRRDVAAILAADTVDAQILSDPASVAWLLNIRGADVPNTPFALAFALIHADASVDLFVDRRKLAPGLIAHLGNEVRVAAPADLVTTLVRFGKAKMRLGLDPAGSPEWVRRRAQAAGAEIVFRDDPCALPKACKNPIEIEGTRTAHRRDGAALTRFLAWLSRTAPKGGLTEIVAAERLEAFRREGERIRSLSFSTISGAGPNGAIVHYRVSDATNRVLESGSLYLVDSGAQYLDGTTDVTRTVTIGTPPAEARDRFTRVLKGHIAIATLRFPEGTTGSQIDILARRPLWEAGLDYDHGTGHGVGSFLGVHEGPHRISKLANRVAFKPGMIVSNEPGYYKTGAYGIRIENLVTVVAIDPPAGAERKLLGFETLTLAPIDTALIEPSLLAPDEIAWLDAYHRRVHETIGPLVDAETRVWLEQATRPIGKG
ncbi:MAG: aminopeptidase P family protein [Rhodospirillales bacterium]|nr:aminopeptidase P family protein [Rhodospirillales bacterium]